MVPVVMVVVIKARQSGGGKEAEGKAGADLGRGGIISLCIFKIFCMDRITALMTNVGIHVGSRRIGSVRRQ